MTSLRSGLRLSSALLLPCLLGFLGAASGASAQTCPPEAPLQWYSGGGQVVCPCFVAGEEAGVVLDAPAGDYPIEILKVGIGWASYFGVSGQTLEQAINVYGAGLPNPGARLYDLLGPVLTDGAINEFNLESQVGNVILNSGPFTVTLEFASDNANDLNAGSVVHDGNGCTGGGKNVIKAIPGGWQDICSQGLGGDWIFYVIYRRTDCGQTGVGDPQIAANVPAFLMNPEPNPFAGATSVQFFLAADGPAAVTVYGIDGRRVAVLADREFSAGTHALSWDGRDTGGGAAPSGIYFVELRAGDVRTTRKVLLNR